MWKMAKYVYRTWFDPIAGADPGGGGAHPARAPPKIGKNMIFFGVKS